MPAAKKGTKNSPAKKDAPQKSSKAKVTEARIKSDGQEVKKAKKIF